MTLAGPVQEVFDDTLNVLHSSPARAGAAMTPRRYGENKVDYSSFYDNSAPRVPRVKPTKEPEPVVYYNSPDEVHDEEDLIEKVAKPKEPEKSTAAPIKQKAKDVVEKATKTTKSEFDRFLLLWHLVSCVFNELLSIIQHAIYK